jgi:glucokinase
VIPALELGGTHVSAALVDFGGVAPSVSGLHRIAVEPHAAAAPLLDAMAECAAKLDMPGNVHWGMAVPGPFDYRSGVAHYHDVGKFESLAGIDVGAELRRRRGPMTIRFLNDAHAFTLGEWRAGAVIGHRRVIGFTLGTGVGSGFLLDGGIVDSGPTVPPQGRIDLTTIDGRPLEDVISRRAMLREYAALVGPSDADVRDLADRARAGDAISAELFATTFGRLGRAVGPWVGRFAADAIVIGGSMARSWDLIGGPFAAGLGRDVPVVLAALGDTSGLVGAAWYAEVDKPAEQTAQ